MSELKPIKGKIFTLPFFILLLLSIVALVFIAKRFMYGIGAVSNMSDGYPWGMWIVYDVVTGTAIACGGYAMAILVYVFNKGQYHPLVRSALLASMFGYTLATVSIFFDVGRYWQMYNIFLPWYSNTNSVMFEVAACIATYVLVMWLEFSPAFFEKPGQEKTLKKINSVMFIFIALGVLLPTMHQSSLGSLMIIAGDKLSGLWQTGFLPLLFLISAIMMGFGMVIFESLFSSVTLKRPLETPLLAKLSGVIPKLLIAFLIIRFGDLIFKGKLGLIFNFNLQSLMFIIENLLFIFPLIILSSQEKKNQSKYLFVSGASLVLAGSVYRFNAFLIGFSPGANWHYFPSFAEIMITVGIISVEIMAYLIFIKTLPVLPDVRHA
ncbi:MAG: Ni/Fe-hydrogenase cytochrome b subunit [Thermodesulfobacteriota bacterium]